MQTNDNSVGILEVDDSGDGYGTSSSTSGGSQTTSLASSLQDWLVENGRRYHAYYGPDKNFMPTDKIEQERLDIHHEIMLLISKGKLYKAPIENPQKVLDLGTGTGVWSIDFASAHPEAEVIGLDLSPIQPNWVPENCRFEVDDFELDWTYTKNSFDFIHARNIAHSVKKWSDVLPQVMSHLKPGAWFELAEIGSEMFSDDNSIPVDWPPRKAWDLTKSGLVKFGRISPTSEWIEQLLRDAGFVDVEVKTFKQPLGAWPKQKDLKQAGELWAMSAGEAYSSYALSLLTRAHGWTLGDAEALCAAGSAAHVDRKSKVHAYSKFFIGYGRKPTESFE